MAYAALEPIVDDYQLVLESISAPSIILMGMKLVASVYGMNFDYMPELGWRFGYPMA